MKEFLISILIVLIMFILCSCDKINIREELNIQIPDSSLFNPNKASYEKMIALCFDGSYDYVFYYSLPEIIFRNFQFRDSNICLNIQYNSDWGNINYNSYCWYGKNGVLNTAAVRNSKGDSYNDGRHLDLEYDIYMQDSTNTLQIETSYIFNSRGFKISEHNGEKPENPLETREYDSLGNLIKEQYVDYFTDAKHKTRYYAYKKGKNIKIILYPDSTYRITALTPRDSFCFTNSSKLLAEAHYRTRDGALKLLSLDKYEYDEKENLIAIDNYRNKEYTNLRSYSKKFFYDNNNRLIRRIYVPIIADEADTIHISYSERGQIKQIHKNKDRTFRFSYNNKGLIKRIDVSFWDENKNDYIKKSYMIFNYKKCTRKEFDKFAAPIRSKIFGHK